MTKRIFTLLLAFSLVFACTCAVFAADTVERVLCETTRGGDYEQMEQTVVRGISHSGAVVWTYDTGMKEFGGNHSNVYWYGQSGDLFFLNYKGSLQVFDIETGEVLWQTPEGQHSYAQGIFDSAGNLCMVNKYGPITLLDRCGDVIARFNTDRKYSSLVTKTMSMSNNRLTIKYAVEGTGANIKEYNDYQKMPSLTVDLAPYQNRIGVSVDGNPLSFDVPPFLERDRTYVPVRAIFEALGAQVSWDGATRTVTAQKGTQEIKMEIGCKEIAVNGSAIVLDVAPQIVNDRTMVPARAVSECFGFTVGWDGKSKTVTISTAQQPSSQPLTVNTGMFSYLGQSYGALSATLGTATKAAWRNGPFCCLGENQSLWFGFGEGEWYRTESDFQLSDDLICRFLLTDAKTLVQNLTGSTTADAIATALGTTATAPEVSELDQTIESTIQYQNHRIVITLNNEKMVTPESVISISE